MQMVVSGRRPPMPPDTPPPLAELIQACWAAEPAERPSFKAVVSQLRQAAKAANIALLRD